MTPRDALMLIEPFGMGILLGGFFFGGLWLTIRCSLASAAAPLWFLASLLIRTGVVLAGFYAVLAAGPWPRLAAALVGFLLARILLGVTLRVGRQPHRATRVDTSHAP